MKKKYKMLAVSLIGLLSFEVVAPSFASNRNYGIEQLSKLTTKVKADDLNIEVPESLQDMALDSNQEIDIQNMNTQELKYFEQIVQEEAEKAELPTTEDTAIPRKSKAISHGSLFFVLLITLSCKSSSSVKPANLA